MTLATERQQFEQWWETAMHNGYPPRFGWEHWRDGDGYRDDDGEFQGLWQAWQVSRGFLANREAQPVYQYRMRNPYNGQVTDWETTKPEQVDFILKETIAANVEFRIIAAPPAQAVPEAITAANAPEVFEIAAEVERLGLRGVYGAYAVGWNACRAAMLDEPQGI